MRLRDDRLLKGAWLRAGGACLALAALAACSGSSGSGLESAGAAMPRANGPQADYPILVGAPYEVNGVSYTPSDTLNYDEVGAAIVEEGAFGITGAHHTLPVPSYVEVTSLETGRTILVRLERRGPMTSNDLVALSPAALAQLGAESGVFVRVRRVNPPEEQRAMLRRGDMAPLRMDTPMSLVNVLRRNLPEAAPVVAAETVIAEDEAGEPVAAPVEEELATAPVTQAPEAQVEPLEVAATDRETGRTTPVAAPVAAEGGFYVQAAAFSSQERADRAAAPLGAFVLAGSDFYRVRTGPFATREEAEASLAKVREAGYDDARILTGG